MVSIRLQVQMIRSELFPMTLSGVIIFLDTQLHYRCNNLFVFLLLPFFFFSILLSKKECLCCFLSLKPQLILQLSKQKQKHLMKKRARSKICPVSVHQSQQIQEKSAYHYTMSMHDIWKILLTSRAAPDKNTGDISLILWLAVHFHQTFIHSLIH